MGRKGNRSWKNNNEAVSEVVGSALLVGLTVVVVSAFGLVATQAFSPIEKLHADLVPQLEAGGCPLLPPNTPPCWANGDERVTVQHLGGSDLTRSLTKIKLTRGTTVTTVEGAALGPVFDGGFRIGETWTHTMTLAKCDSLMVQIIVQHNRGSSQLLTQDTLVAHEGAC